MYDRESSYKFYSIGIVLVDKERKSDLIPVFALEELSQATGADQTTTIDGALSVKEKLDQTKKFLNEQKTNYTVNIPDHQGIDRKVSLTGDKIIIAKWTAIGQSNRMTPPDVIAGESVMIYRVGDTQDYFWTTLMREPSIRRQETVCEMYGNIPSGQVAWDKDTSYWKEVSTHDKYWHIHTSKNDGEPFAYDIKIDTAKGIVSVDDNAGNNIILDSSAGKLTIDTLNDVECNTQNVVVNATVKADVNTITATINASVSLRVNTPNAYFSENVLIGGALTTGTSGPSDITMNGDLKHIGNEEKTGDCKMTGNNTIGGDNQVSGDQKTDGSQEVGGSIKVGGDAAIQGHLTAGSIN